MAFHLLHDSRGSGPARGLIHGLAEKQFSTCRYTEMVSPARADEYFGWLIRFHAKL